MKRLLALLAVVAVSLGACGREDLSSVDPGYRADPRSGCKVWFDYPWKGETPSWNGPCVDGYAEGKGIAEGLVESSVRHRYVGGMRRGKRDGWGRLYRMDADGSIEGDWHDGLQEGRLILYEAGETVSYRGQGRDGAPYGLGTDGVYQGDHRETGRHGLGALTLKQGRYDGRFVDGYPEGEGTLVTIGGRRYTGIWKRGCLDQGRRWATVGRRPSDCGIASTTPANARVDSDTILTSGG